MTALPVVSLLLMLLRSVAAIPLCLNQESPFSLSSTLSFCSSPAYSSKGCCTQGRDAELAQRFRSMNISNAGCAEFIQQILCSECDAFSEDLYTNSKQQSTPTLCNSGQSSNSSGYCSDFWNSCKDVPILNSPFSPYLAASGSPSPPATISAKKTVQDDTLATQWESEQDFCTVLGAPMAAGNFCFSGSPFTFPPAEADNPPQGLCLHKVSLGSYITMVAHPDGSDRVFVANQQGKVWIATVSKNNTHTALLVNDSAPYLDISDLVVDENELGLLGLAFHPNFLHNGRFFVSYNCDTKKWPNCVGICACNMNVGCDPTKAGNGADAVACRYSSVVAEYSANGSSSSLGEVRRIFTMGLPFSTHHAGQILFGPTDKYLYYMLGDGGSIGDPFNFSQNKMSLLGKVLRLDIDNLPSPTEVSAFQPLGNYAIPKGNPFNNDNTSRPEIWALGFRNPWRCSFDALQPSYLYCADVGQDSYEEVDLVTRGGNYGWNMYEGSNLYPQSSSQINKSNLTPVPPIIEYNHSSVNPMKGSAAIIGGYVSHSQEDPCVYGRYLYADLFGEAIWAAAELPAGSGTYTTARINITCSPSSPFTCEYATNSTIPNFKFIESWGQDNDNNIYILSQTGVFKVVSPNQCNYVCNKMIGITPSPSTGRPTMILGPTYLIITWLTWALLYSGSDL